MTNRILSESFGYIFTGLFSSVFFISSFFFLFSSFFSFPLLSPLPLFHPSSSFLRICIICYFIFVRFEREYFFPCADLFLSYVFRPKNERIQNFAIVVWDRELFGRLGFGHGSIGQSTFFFFLSYILYILTASQVALPVSFGHFRFLLIFFFFLLCDFGTTFAWALFKMQ